MDADEREAVDGEEQHDADAAESVEQSGPPVGLYLKDSMVSVLLSTFIYFQCVLKRMRRFARRLSHDIRPVLASQSFQQERATTSDQCAGDAPRSGGKSR